MTRENLGGFQGELYVRRESNGGCSFYNDTYGMITHLHPDDINDFLKHPYQRSWGVNHRSRSNSIDGKDLDIMINYLTNVVRKYKTVTDVMKSRSKYKEKYLMQFPMEELQEYIKKKEEKNGKVKSCG